jgi:hypothetical protein
VWIIWWWLVEVAEQAKLVLAVAALEGEAETVMSVKVALQTQAVAVVAERLLLVPVLEALAEQAVVA